MFRRSFLAWALCMMASAAVAETAYRDLSFGSRERNLLDLYLPDTTEKPALVLYVHGGAWFRGDKRQVEDYDSLNSLLDAGPAVASMNYTWSQQQIWPARGEDLRRAITFLQQHSDQYGYDMNRFAVWGQSSGAYLALWSAIMGARDEELGIDAIVSWYAPSNLHALRQDRIDDGVPGANENELNPTPESQLIGADALKDIPAADAASPEAQVRQLKHPERHPPVLLIHGTMDTRVSPLQSARMFDTLNSAAVPVELLTVDGGGHGGQGFLAMVPPSLDHILRHLSPDN